MNLEPRLLGFAREHSSVQDQEWAEEIRVVVRRVGG